MFEILLPTIIIRGLETDDFMLLKIVNRKSLINNH